jgi:hypothetical protein
MNARAKPLYKAFDAAMTASLQPKQPVSDLARRVFRPRLSNYERVATAINLLDGLLPGASRRVFRSLYNPYKLPFAVRQIELLSFGSGSTVFLMDIEGGGERVVLKLYRRSLGKRDQDLYQLAEHVKQKYEQVSGWYRGPYDLVQPSAFLILHGPLLGQSAAGVIQSYIQGEKKDFFRSFSDGELLSLMEQEEFRDQFLFFACRTLEVFQQSRQCFDFIGRDNLMVVLNEGRARLAVIDFGIFDLNLLEGRSPALCRQIEANIQRIESLHRRVRSF